MNKRGSENVILGNVMFAVLNVSFFVIMFIAVSRAGTSAAVFEEASAKQITLLIDNSKPGTQIEIDISKLILIAKDKSVPLIIIVNCDANEVIVKATQNGGYASKFFTELDKCDYILDTDKRKFTINT